MISIRKYIPFIIGFIFFYNGLLFSYLFFDGHSPFYQSRSPSSTNQIISPNFTEDLGEQIGCTPSSFPNRIKLSVLAEGSSPLEVFVYYKTNDRTILLESFTVNEITKFEIEVEISGELLSSSYFIELSIENLGPDEITINSIQASELSMLFGLYIWALSFTIGLILMALNILYVKKRKPGRIKQTTPEPVLFQQYQQKSKKVLNKTSKKSVNQQKHPLFSNKCPSCGGALPRNAKNCPHCFTFIKNL